MKNMIAKFRKEAKMSQQEFADRFGMSREQVSRIENGHAEITLAIADEIATLFGVTVYELFVTMGSSSTYNLKMQELKDQANAAYKEGMRKVLSVMSETPYN